MPRVRVEVAYHEFFRQLAMDDAETTKRRTFDTMKDVFMVCLGIGVAHSQRSPLGPSRDIFDDSVLRDSDWDIIKAVALTEEAGELEVLANPDQLLQIAQEYANSGVRILQREFLPAQPEESIAATVLNALPKSG